MKIYPAFDLASDHHSQPFIASMEQLLEELIPADILALQNQPELFLQHIKEILPILHYAPLKKEGNAFTITVLSHAEYTHGTGRFLSDALSRRLIPGKRTELVGTRTLSFYFFADIKREFFITERWIMANHPHEIALIEERLPRFVEELHLTFLCVVRARHFLSLKSSQSPLIPEIQHLSTFEQMHGIIQRLTAEKTMSEIRQYINPIYQLRPKIFDRDIFEEIKSFISLYHEKFSGKRTVRTLAQLVCYHFYFQKRLLELCSQNAIARHLFLKVFNRKVTLGILVLFNLSREKETFRKSHLLEAIRQCLSPIEEVEDSYLIDTSADTHLFFYIEIRKKRSSFTHSEIRTLRQNLPQELKACIQRRANPLFMLRNEEDHMRYLIALSREIHSVKDIPQLVISFDEQTDETLIFSVIMVRVLTARTTPLKDLLSQLPLKSILREQRTVGLLRKKYPKEASIFKIELPKHSYLRKDHSLDLPRARQALVTELNNTFQEVRDYNGGLLAKQLEALQHLKALLGPLAENNAFALENFFFSIEPPTAQMTIPPSQLKEGFLLLLNLIKTNTSSHATFSMAGFVLYSQQEKDHFQAILHAARANYQDISYSLTSLHDLFCCIVFFPIKSPDLDEIRNLFHSFLQESLKNATPMR